MNFSQELVNILLATAPPILYVYLFYIFDMFEQRIWRSYIVEQWRTEGRGGLGGSNYTSRNSEGPTKSCQNQPDCGNC